MADEDDVGKALASLRILQSKFARKINELKTVRHITEDSLRHNRIVTVEECDKLQADLEHLNHFKHKYEASVDAFTSKFESKYPQQSVEVAKSSEECLNAFLNITINVRTLLRRISNKLKADDIDGFAEGDEQSEKEGEEEKDKEGSNKKLEENGPQHSTTTEEPSLGASGYLLICVQFLVVVIVFYSILGFIIYQVQKNQQQKKEGIC